MTNLTVTRRTAIAGLAGAASAGGVAGAAIASGSPEPKLPVREMGTSINHVI